MTVREALEAIYTRDGQLDPEVVVSEAVPEDSPLHKHFEWDDSKAAHQHRLDTATRLIRIKVTYSTGEDQKFKVRVYTNVHPDGDSRKAGTYISTEEALLTHRDQVLMQAEREVQSFLEKYRGLEELSSILDSMESYIQKTSATRVPAAA